LRTRITAALVAVLALLSWAGGMAAPALAQAPLRLSGEITDHAGALGDRRGDVQAAITQLYDKDRIKLYVVYVSSFSGLSPTAWVDQTAAINGFGTRDVLLGVATSDRNYAVSADPAMGLSATQLDGISSIAIEPALRRSNWPAAAIGAASGFAAAAAGRPIPAPSLSAAVTPRHGGALVVPAAGRAAPGGSFTGIEIAAIAAAGVLLLALLLLLGRRMSRHGPGGPRVAGPPAGPTTAELEAQSSRALVETDDAIRTSVQELGFAIARFGEHAAAPFSAALRAASAELSAAFKLRQLLDDDVQETEPVRRSMLAEISGRCAEASRLLDEQSEAFDRLQNLEARAPAVLAEVDHHVSQQDARAGRCEELLTQLAARYTPAAVAAVATSPGQARERLEFARGRADAARAALAEDSTGEAAVCLQAAESAADQAESLLTGIEHMQAELTQAYSALPTTLREIDADIAEATALLGAQDDRAAAVARARAAASDARAQLAAGAPFDALATLRELEQSGTELDGALASARAERERQERASAVLDQVMLVARSSITAAEDFITTRRGAVGAAARTRLAEAQRHFQQAIAYGQANPEGALAEAQHADALGQQARALAEQDVTQFSYDQQGPVIRTGGGFGGGFGGAILGGILVDSLLGGGRRGGSGGGFGLGGLGPGSFGGIGTRGRHSIGGRF
jgi:hypothetical protein